MRISNPTNHNVYTKVLTSDDEGNNIVTYSEPFIIRGYSYCVSGTKSANQYGDSADKTFKLLSNDSYYPTLIGKQQKWTNGVNTFGVGDRAEVELIQCEIKSIQKHGHLVIVLEAV